MRLAFFLSVLLTAFTPAMAQTSAVPGQHEDSYLDAVGLWLDGDDAAALRALSELAKDNNTAAQILLSGIASRAHMHQHVTAALPRKDRIALLRVPKGLSGKSWLTEAQKTAPLATALLQASKIGEKAGAIAALVELGEPETALLAAQSILFQGEAKQLAEVLQGLEEQLPDAANPLLVWTYEQIQAQHAGGGKYAGSIQLAAKLKASDQSRIWELAWLPPSPKALTTDPGLFEQTSQLQSEVPSWTPLRSFCETQCPQTTGACVAVGASLLSNSGPFPLRSPRESLISNETYWRSSRMTADLARSLDIVASQKSPAFGALNACFMEAMTQAQQTHGHRLK